MFTLSTGVSLTTDVATKFESNIQMLMALSVAENSLAALKVFLFLLEL